DYLSALPLPHSESDGVQAASSSKQPASSSRLRKLSRRILGRHIFYYNVRCVWYFLFFFIFLAGGYQEHPSLIQRIRFPVLFTREMNRQLIN
ncbi:hypothetical protein T310_5143, partial [Rasamsonia emersonii CBS 393.64]